MAEEIARFSVSTPTTQSPVASAKLMRMRLAREDCVNASTLQVEHSPQVRMLTAIHPACLGLAITLGQLCLAMLLAGTPDLKLAYRRLLQTDSNWYRHIAVHGYRSTLPPPTVQNPNQANVAYLPGYPLWVLAVQRVCHANIDKAMLIAAQLACWGFWTYFFLLLRVWRIADDLVLAGVLLLLAHPTAFFLVAGYSESLFLLTLLGVIFWSHSCRGLRSTVLIGMHGFVMTATRIVGAPCAFYPLWLFLASPQSGPGTRRSWKGLTLASAATVVGLLGILSFFAYCYCRWGVWDLYLQTQRNGWQVAPDYCVLLKWQSYVTPFTTYWTETINHNRLSRLLVPITLVGFAALLVLEALAAREANGSWRMRLGLYGAAWMLFYLPASGQAGAAQFTGMNRYCFCSHVLMVLILLHLLSSAPRLHQRFRKCAPLLMILAAPFLGVSFAVQTMLTYQFLRGAMIG